jgi:hypothetical protein
MSISVVVRPVENVTTSVKSERTVVSSVTIAPQTTISLGNLTNVDASDPDDGETLVYDEVLGKYIVKAITVDSNNITNINGGTF